MRHVTSRFVPSVLVLATCACGYRDGPPVQAPSAVVPAAVAPIVASAPADRAVVVLEANGEPAKVSEVFASTAQGVNGTFTRVETAKPLCIAPCRVDLPPGLHELRYSSTTDRRVSDVDVMIDGKSKVVRHSMEERIGSRGGMISGGLLLGLGGSFVLTGLATSQNDAYDRDFRELGTVTMAIGVVTAVVGAIVLAASAGVRRPGATTEVALPARAPSEVSVDATVAAADR